MIQTFVSSSLFVQQYYQNDYDNNDSERWHRYGRPYERIERIATALLAKRIDCKTTQRKFISIRPHNVSRDFTGLANGDKNSIAHLTSTIAGMRHWKMLCRQHLRKDAAPLPRNSISHGTVKTILSIHIYFINVKNFYRSLTTVVRVQNDTSKTAIITDIIFSRKIW